MRKLTLILISIFFFSCENRDNQNDSSEILSIIQEQQHQWNMGSIDGFMKGYWDSPELKFITKNGIKKGYKEVSESYKSHYKSKMEMGQLNFSDIEISPLDDSKNIYNATGKWEIMGDIPLKGYFSLIVKRIDDTWKVTIDHTW
jgi:hypothetical protein